jgi:AbrB family looped-hinge helix DNA binding protein
MTERVFTENAVISSKGQLTIPKEVRKVLGVDNGEKVTFVVVGDEVKIVNAAAYAMKVLQTEMIGEATKAGLNSEEDIVSLIKELRAGR